MFDNIFYMLVIKMVRTTLNQKWCKRGHFIHKFDSHSYGFNCRAKCKGQDHCAQGTDMTQCAAAFAALTEEP